MDSPIFVLMGPTASGKSALGMVLAQKLNAVILNADTMQCYADLRTITARPSEADEATTEHQLYGMWSADVIGSAMLWQEAAVAAIRSVIASGKTPLLLGGTGMYLQGLTKGIAPVPAISAQVREKVRNLSPRRMTGSGCRHEDGMTLYEHLQALDPAMAARLKAGDTQRIARALEVILETGKSLDYWHQQPIQTLFKPEQFRYAYIDIARQEVYARIDWRFDQMMQQGALAEVEELMHRLDPSLRAAKRRGNPEAADSEDGLLRSQEPARKDALSIYPILKAHGVPELMGYLRGERSLDDSVDKAKQHTRNYAKRQMTWIRNQCAGAGVIAYGANPITLDEACFLPLTSHK